MDIVGYSCFEPNSDSSNCERIRRKHDYWVYLYRLPMDEEKQVGERLIRSGEVDVGVIA